MRKRIRPCPVPEPADRTGGFVAKIALRGMTSNTLTTVAQLKANLQQAKRRGA